MSRFTLAAVAALLACGPLSVMAQTADAPDQPVGLRLLAAVHAADVGSGQPPLLSDPATASLVRETFDRAAFGPDQQVDLQEYERLCLPAVQVQQAYLMFDFDREGTIDRATQAGAATATRVMDRNWVRYQDELALGSAFGIRCNGGVVPAMERFLAGLPPQELNSARREGVQRMRLGLTQVYRGTAMMIVDPRTSPANRIMLIEEAVLQADSAAAILKPEERREVIAAIDQLTPYAAGPVTRQGFAKIKASLSRTDCTALCAF